MRLTKEQITAYADRSDAITARAVELAGGDTMLPYYMYLKGEGIDSAAVAAALCQLAEFARKCVDSANGDSVTGMDSTVARLIEHKVREGCSLLLATHLIFTECAEVER